MRIGVLGAGVMGSGIAQVAATAGHDAVCFDVSADALERAEQQVVSGRYGFGRAVERGKLTAAQAEEAQARLRFTDQFDEAAAAADVVIEAVPEDLGLKVETFRRLDRAAPADAILASNTSGLPIVAMAAATERPAKVIGWHWASPPVVMRLAEIAVTPMTDDATVEIITGLAGEFGKNPIVVKDNPMAWVFVANRVYFAMIREATRVVDEGIATREQVDQLMTDCFNWPVGPFGMTRGASGGWK